MTNTLRQKLSFFIGSESAYYQLPVNPLTFDNNYSVNHEEVDFVEGKSIRVGNVNLHEFVIDGVVIDRFAKTHYGNSVKYLGILENLFKAKNPVHFLVFRDNDVVIDREYLIRDFSYAQEVNKFTYSMTLIEYRKLHCKEIGEVILPESEALPDGYEDSSSDTIANDPSKDTVKKDKYILPRTMTFNTLLGTLDISVLDFKYMSELKRLNPKLFKGIFVLGRYIDKGTVINLPK